MSEEHATTDLVQRFLDEMGGNSSAEPVGCDQSFHYSVH
jgi:hypothetical protein